MTRRTGCTRKKGDERMSRKEKSDKKAADKMRQLINKNIKNNDVKIKINYSSGSRRGLRTEMSLLTVNK